MALDNAQFISELSITDPPGTDPLSEGDDQIRTTKRATFQSFPNVDAQVSLTAAQLNDAALKSQSQTITATWTHSASLVLDNNVTLFGRDLTTAARSLAVVDGSDIATFGDATLNQLHRMLAQGEIQVGGVTVGFYLPLVSGGMVVRDIGGVSRKVGFRNPGTTIDTVSRTLLQADEQTLIVATQVITLTVNTLEQGTQIDVLTEAGPLTLLEGNVTLRWLDGGGTSAPLGNRTVAQSSIIHLAWETNNVVDVWGNGIT